MLGSGPAADPNVRARMTNLTFTYDPFEDRLFLLSGPSSPPTVLILTRRLVAGLVDAMAKAVETANAAVHKAPADLRDEVVRMAHEDAVARTRRSEAEWTVQRAIDHGSVPVLVSRLDLHIRGSQIVLDIFDQTSQRGQIATDRQDLHQILQTLLSFAARANWNLQPSGGWLVGNAQEGKRGSRLTQ